MEILENVVRPRIMKNEHEMPLSWQDLKDFIMGLTEAELKQQVIVWGEETGGGIFAIAKTTEDLINPSGDGLEPVSIYANSDDPDDKEIAENESAVYKKGKLILQADF